MRIEKQKQVEEIKDLWKQEKSKFDLIIKDDGALEQQILDVYKKY